MNKEFLGIAGLLTVTILWGGGFIAGDLALAVLSPVQIMAARFLLASVIMFFAVWKDIRTISKREFAAGVVLGVFLFAAFLLQTLGLQFSTPSKNAFLTATNVIFVPFIVWAVYKKRPAFYEFAAMLLAFAGAGVLSLENDFSVGTGEVFSLACAFFFACQIFFTGRYALCCRAGILNFVQMTTAFILSCAVLPFTNGIAIIWNKQIVLSVLYLGAVSTALTFFLQTYSQKYVKQVQAVVILSLEAVFATFFSILLVHEQLSPRIVCGAFLILIAVLVSEIKLK